MHALIIRTMQALRRDHLLQALLLLAVVLELWKCAPPLALLNSVNWPTIATLYGLLALTKGIETSGALAQAGRQLIDRMHGLRGLALLLVAAAAALSMLLTNDVALFIAVPLTLGLRRHARLPIGRLVIFEALAVNAGSLMSPIGNPQNILLWHSTGLSAAAFISQMAPLGGVLLILLLGMTAAAFPNIEIERREPAETVGPDLRLFASCGVAYLAYLGALAFGQPVWAAAGVSLFMLTRARAVLRQIDWGLLLVFVLMFIDVHLVTGLAALQPLLTWGADAPVHRFVAGLAWSQAISNVPATILLLQQHAGADRLLAYAVNVGGFGSAIGSLANLIALRLAAEPGLGWRFHAWSVPVLLVAAPVAWWLLQVF